MRQPTLDTDLRHVIAQTKPYPLTCSSFSLFMFFVQRETVRADAGRELASSLANKESWLRSTRKEEILDMSIAWQTFAEVVASKILKVLNRESDQLI